MVVAATLLVAACSDGSDDAQPRTTVPTAPALTTTTNPYAVPDVIDVAYVNRVLAGLDAAVGDVVRIVVGAQTLTPEALDRLESLYTGETFTRRVNTFIAETAQGFRGYKSPVGNQRTTVKELITVKTTCIFTRVHRDFSQVAEAPDPSLSDQYVGLQRVERAGQSLEFNPTLWTMVYDGFLPDRTRPRDPCAATS